MLLILPAMARAGPPLVTDDTGTVEPGTFEYLLYVSGERRDINRSGELPGIEFSYGLNESMDITLVLPRQYTDGEPALPAESDLVAEETEETGFGTAEIGWKWRFYDEGFSLAFAPSYSFPLSEIAQVRGLIEKAHVLSLPIVATVIRGDWELGGEVGYDAYRRDLDAFRYGIYTAFQATDSLRLMGEVWGNDFFSDGDSLSFTNWRVGLEWAVSERITLSAAGGGGIWSELDSEKRLRGDYFLGLGWTH